MLYDVLRMIVNAVLFLPRFLFMEMLGINQRRETRYAKRLVEDARAKGLKEVPVSDSRDKASLKGSIDGVPFAVEVRVRGGWGTGVSIKAKAPARVRHLRVQTGRLNVLGMRLAGVDTPSIVPFTTACKPFNSIFPTRNADRETAELLSLSGSCATLEKVAAFYARWFLKILEFTIVSDDEGAPAIEVLANEGISFHPYVKPDTFRLMVAQLLEVVGVFVELFPPPLSPEQKKASKKLHKALYDYDYEKAEQAIAAGADPNFLNEDRKPAILAARTKEARFLKLVLDHGANVNGRDLSGNTALHEAIMYRAELEAAKTLIDAGIDVDAIDDRRQTPLIRAAHSERADIVRLLLENGANKDLEDEDGKRAMDYADRWPEVKALLS